MLLRLLSVAAPPAQQPPLLPLLLAALCQLGSREGRLVSGSVGVCSATNPARSGGV